MADLATGLAGESSHWYARDGSCVYEIRGANGAMRPVTLRDARKLGLVPGFSTISQMEYKPALERWKIEQAYLAALTLPPREGETLESFRARAREDAEASSLAARERGSHLHAAVQGHFEDAPLAAEDVPYVAPVIRWINEHFPRVAWSSERSFAHPAGYGGKIDLCADGVTIDFKFKDFTEDTIDKVRGYDEHEMQLHAYEFGRGARPGAKVNLFISSTVPGLIVPVEWKHNESALAAFLCLLELWQIRRKYDSAFDEAAA